jgi:magnesium chelatase subunit D
MNPEEGELRPQLLDRFGLAVEVRAPRDPTLRAEIVRRRLAYDADPAEFCHRFASDEEDLARALVAAGQRLGGVAVPDAVLDMATELCAEFGAEGLRADLVLARGAAAMAALNCRPEASSDDVVRLAPLALAHRRRRGPLDAPGLNPAELQEALERLNKERESGEGDDGSEHDLDDGGARPAVPPAPGVLIGLDPQRPSGALGRHKRGPSARGGVVAAVPPTGPLTDLALPATVAAAAARRALEPDAASIEQADLRQAVREARTAHLVVLCVDASGSMGAERRMEAAKGAVLSLLLDAYQRRDRVALVTFAGEGARIALRPTGSVEVARARLTELPTGGRTPLAAGLRTALDLARLATRTDPGRRPMLVVVTDGRATAPAPDPAAAALAAAADVARAGLDALVVDAEDGNVRLGLAASLAEAMGARYLALPQLAPEPLARAVTMVAAGLSDG